MNVESHFKEWIQSTFPTQSSRGRPLINFWFWNINATRTTLRPYYREDSSDNWLEREIPRDPGSECLRRKVKAEKEERKILSIEFIQEIPTERNKSLCISLLELHNKVWQTEWLKQQKFIISQFWRPEVSDQDVNKLAPFEGCEEELVPCLSPSLWVVFWKSLAFLGIYKHHPDLCLYLHIVLFLCMCLGSNFPFS